jgi:TolB-like protein/cytochrome c-type biogenesis protein CcmH/NrfG
MSSVSYLPVKAWKPIEVKLFGRFRVIAANGDELAINGKRVRALLAILCLHPGEAIEREHISQLLWQGKFRAQARASLRQTLLELKQQLAEICDDPFIGGREQIAIRAELISSDLIDLHKALASEQYASAGSQLQSIGTQTLLEGLDDGQDLGLAFSEFLDTKRVQLEAQLTQTVEQIFTNTSARDLDYARSFLQEAIKQRGQDSTTNEALIRIAVLPFAVQSSGESLQLFTNGLFEELITTLAQIPQLRVAGRGSARQLASCASAIDTASKLKVTNLIEGTVRRQGKTIIVHAALLDGDDGCQSWSGRFEGKSDDLFSLQQTIAVAITEELGQALKRQIKPPPVRRRSTINKEAYSLYLQGRALTVRAIGDGVLAKAIELLEAALAIDPNFAACWTALAEAHVYTAVYTPCLDRLGQSQKMAKCATRAIELEPTQGHARTMLGIHRWTQNDPLGALDLAFEAYRLEPNNPDVVLRLGSFLLYIGRTRDALPYIQAAVDQDPVNGRNYAMLSVAHLNLGNIDLAIEAGQRMVDLGLPSMWLGVAISASGDRKRAINQYRQTMKLMNKTMFPPAGSKPLSGAALYAFWELASRGVCSGKTVHRKLYCTLLDRLHKTLHDPCDTSIVQPAIWMGYSDMVFKTLGTQITPANMFCMMSLWADLEPIKQIRLHPDFLPFAKRIGLVAAWDRYGWPDLLPPPQ